jgi:3-hydroxyacyl-[acyl-carrier-protein] dehydratase
MSNRDLGAMSRLEIEHAIPHRAPMLLVDEIIESRADCIVGRKTFRPDEYFLDGHYPGNPIVPGVILCESAIQTGAVLLSRSYRVGLPVLTRINDVRFRGIVRSGDTVEHYVELTDQLSNAFYLSAKTVRGAQVVVRFEFACALTESI